MYEPNLWELEFLDFTNQNLLEDMVIATAKKL